MSFNFRLGSIPVRVHGSFLLVVLFLGLGGGDAAGLVQWALVVFAGVLLHELGHALVGRSFGLTPQIDLIGFGGLTSWSAGDARALSAAKRIAISLAGPFTGIAIGIGTWVFIRARGGFAPLGFFDHDTPWTSLTYVIVWVNAGWGLLNLLPILPMDGGNVLFQSLNWLTKGQGEKPARIVSLVAAASICLLALLFRQTYGAFLAGIFAVQNVQALRAATSRERDAPLVALLKLGFDALGRGESAEGIRVGRDVLSRATDAAVRSDAVRLLAFGYLLARDWGELMQLMESPASGAIGDAEMAKFEQAARELERPDEANRIAAVVEKRRRPRL
ncbi:MAG: metalloprotease [Polyangiaceae bacterium]